MSIEAAISDAVTAAVAPMLAELRALRAEMAALRAASPSQLVTVNRLVELGYGSPATVRRRIADNTYPAIRHGRSIRVDLASLKPPSPEVIAELAREARKGS
jgi:hypothetical protein